MASPTLPKKTLARLAEIPNTNAALPYLRAGKPARRFGELRQAVFDQSGYDFLSRVDLLRPPTYVSHLEMIATRSRHICGDAFDIDGFDPKLYTSPDVVNGQSFWRLWIASQRKGSYQRLRNRLEETVTIKVVDFTELAISHGFARVPAFRGWQDDKRRALWWHFQSNDNLTWDESVRFLYDARDLKRPMRLALSERVFGLGDRGMEVRNVQTMLETLGRLDPTEVDGIFALPTRDAIFGFQSDNQIKPTGVAEAKTRRQIIDQVLALVGEKERPSQ